MNDDADFLLLHLISLISVGSVKVLINKVPAVDIYFSESSSAINISNPEIIFPLISGMRFKILEKGRFISRSLAREEKSIEIGISGRRLLKLGENEKLLENVEGIAALFSRDVKRITARRRQGKN